jgi:hypothetical protein
MAGNSFVEVIANQSCKDSFFNSLLGRLFVFCLFFFIGAASLLRPWERWFVLADAARVKGTWLQTTMLRDSRYTVQVFENDDIRHSGG